MIRRPPRSTRTDTLFPYTTRFRSGETIEVLYVVRNTGTAAAAAPWTDRIYIDDDQTISGAATLTSLPRNFNLAPGDTYEIRQHVTIRSAERRIGQECVSKCGSLWATYN